MDDRPPQTAADHSSTPVASTAMATAEAPELPTADHSKLVAPLEQSLLDQVAEMLGTASADASASAAEAGVAAGAAPDASIDDVLSDLFGSTPEPTVVAPLPAPAPVLEAAITPSVPEPLKPTGQATLEPTALPRAVSPDAVPDVVVASADPVTAPIAPDLRRFYTRILDATVLRPLQRISAPVAGLSPVMRTVVGVLGLTLLVWLPAIWWLAGHVATADRIRPLNAEEMSALAAAAHPREHAAKDSGKGDHKAAKKDEKKPEAHAEKKPNAHAEKKPAKKDEKPEKKADKKPAKAGGEHGGH